MPPRFLQRLERQTQVYRQVFGETPVDPPPYPSSRSFISTASGSSYNSLAAPPPAYYEVNHSGGVGYDKPAIPADSLVLVVGASGWQGIHVVGQLLEHGYRVRGTVRNAEKAIWVSNCFKELYGVGRFMPVVVPDMVVQGAFDTAVKGCAGVIHCASVNSFSSNPTEVITPSIAGALNVLQSAAKELSIRRFVYCSSIAAASSVGTDKPNDVTSQSWNMSSFNAAWQPPPYEQNRAWDVFASSKLQGEQSVWRWYRDHKPIFMLNCVLPGMTWGKLIDTQHSQRPKNLSILKDVFDGYAGEAAWIPPQYFVDVQDAALLHVAALILPGIQQQRLFAVNLPYNINSVLALLRGLYPNKDFGDDILDHGVEMSRYPEMRHSEELLRRMGKKGWTDIETSISRSCEAFF